ncbi:hypothetical protein TNCV_3711121 [Trichonephila clavipes]|uniref:Uncharacterized protein n=1 Tax=Trichonephila clavipes TaxID=2585209 RepID=A0A8X6R8X4_TRICX|nr:hypothetical protein TNCV_3711121 [Trichonephila clavipes]
MVSGIAGMKVIKDPRVGWFETTMRIESSRIGGSETIRLIVDPRVERFEMIMPIEDLGINGFGMIAELKGI